MFIMNLINVVKLLYNNVLLNLKFPFCLNNFFSISGSWDILFFIEMNMLKTTSGKKYYLRRFLFEEKI